MEKIMILEKNACISGQLIFVVFEMGSHLVQVGLCFAMLLRMTSSTDSLTLTSQMLCLKVCPIIPGFGQWVYENHSKDHSIESAGMTSQSHTYNEAGSLPCAI